MAVFGAQLAAGDLQATDLPLPTSLAGASLLIGGQQAPLFFSSDGQLNAVVPYGVAANTQQQAIATRASRLSVPQSLIIAPAAPGIFTLPNSKQAIVVDVDSNGVQTIVDATHPAHVGHALVIYCTGLGEVDPPVPSGTGAPSNPPARAVNPVTVTIGGVVVEPAFTGLTPTQVGLYQVNIVIPPVTPGTEVPLILTSAGQSSTPVTITVQ